MATECHTWLRWGLVTRYRERHDSRGSRVLTISCKRERIQPWLQPGMVATARVTKLTIQPLHTKSKRGHVAELLTNLSVIHTQLSGDVGWRYTTESWLLPLKSILQPYEPRIFSDIAQLQPDVTIIFSN